LTLIYETFSTGLHLNSMEESISVAPADKDKPVFHIQRSGDMCPSCRQGRLEYDGRLNLACPNCAYAVGGCYT